jgi:hypothetical protein
MRVAVRGWGGWRPGRGGKQQGIGGRIRPYRQGWGRTHGPAQCGGERQGRLGSVAEYRAGQGDAEARAVARARTGRVETADRVGGCGVGEWVRVGGYGCGTHWQAAHPSPLSSPRACQPSAHPLAALHSPGPHAAAVSGASSPTAECFTHPPNHPRERGERAWRCVLKKRDPMSLSRAAESAAAALSLLPHRAYSCLFHHCPSCHPSAHTHPSHPPAAHGMSRPRPSPSPA